MSLTLEMSFWKKALYSKVSIDVLKILYKTELLRLFSASPCPGLHTVRRAACLTHSPETQTLHSQTLTWTVTLPCKPWSLILPWQRQLWTSAAPQDVKGSCRELLSNLCSGLCTAHGSQVRFKRTEFKLQLDRCSENFCHSRKMKGVP